RHHLAPEGNQLFGRIAGNPIAPDGVVLGIEKHCHCRQSLHGAEDVIEVIAIAIQRTLLKILHLPVSRLTAPLLRTGKQRQLRHRSRPLTQVVFEAPPKTFEVIQETLGVNHRASLPLFGYGISLWCPQSSSLLYHLVCALLHGWI